MNSKGETQFRKIHNPDSAIRKAQYLLLTRILDKIEIPDYIYGFEKNKSIPKMAAAHVNQDVVISLDIRSFFDSIRQYMVVSMFKEMGFQDTISKVMAELVTYKYYVPQGSITAPKISNLIVMGTFGPEIKEFCDKKKITLTVYADDITVSYKEPKPTTAEEKLASKTNARNIIKTISTIVEKYRFKINHEKTKIMYRGNRLWVCGAVVNEKVNMRKQERYLLKAIVHNTYKNGVDKEAAKTGMEGPAFIKKYAGRINWLCQLNPDFGIKLKANFRKATAGYLKKYPDIQIPELAWNSGIEIPYEESIEDKEIFEGVGGQQIGDFKIIKSQAEDVPF